MIRRKKPQKNTKDTKNTKQTNPKSNTKAPKVPKVSKVKASQKDRWWNARASIVKQQGIDEITKPTAGRPPYFPTPEDLWEACCEYFEWVEDNPEYGSQVIAYKGQGSTVAVPKKRAMTLTGIQMFLGMRPQTWWDYRDNKGEGFKMVCEAAQRVIWVQKFTGAAADLLNQAIIARDLGLKDSHEVSGPGGRPIQTESKQKVKVDLSDLSDEELDILEKVAKKNEQKNEQKNSGK